MPDEHGTITPIKEKCTLSDRKIYKFFPRLFKRIDESQFAEAIITRLSKCHKLAYRVRFE